MRKKVCPRPQCEKEYLEGEGFEELIVCKLCGAPLEEVFVEDYDVEDNVDFEDIEDNVDIDDISDIEDNDDFEENIDYKTDRVVCEEDKETFEERNCFVDIEMVDNSLEGEVIIASEDTESDKDSLDNEESTIINFNEEENVDSDNVDPYENIKGNNLILYKENEIFKVYELKYDETIIGRNSSEFTPDIDLQEVDNENATSRKHVLVYKEDDNYYLRNLSKKCSVHIKRYDENEPRVVPFNESVIIEDGDFMVLSGKFILEAFLNEVEE